MHAFLSKRMKYPRGSEDSTVTSVAWDTERGWLCYGGDGGTVKAVRLSRNVPDGGQFKPVSLTSNIRVRGHEGAVTCLSWNSHLKRLAGGDERGRIVCWRVDGRELVEDTTTAGGREIHNPVHCLVWSPDGTMICSAQENGLVVVASQAYASIGKRKLRETLKFMQWDPYSTCILGVTNEDRVMLLDTKCREIKEVSLVALRDEDGNPTAPSPIVAVHWYDQRYGLSSQLAPDLMIAFEDGRIQLTQDVDGPQPVLIDAGMTITTARMSPDGVLLAVAGVAVRPSEARTKGGGEEEENRECTVVQFYECSSGDHLQTLLYSQAVATITGLAWDGDSSRLAITEGGSITLADVRPHHRWACCDQTIVFAHTDSTLHGTLLTFWNYSPGAADQEPVRKTVHNLHAIAAHGAHCALAVDSGDPSSPHSVMLATAVGAPVDLQYTEFRPTFLAMASHTVVAADEHSLFAWSFLSPHDRARDDGLSALRKKLSRTKTRRVAEAEAEDTVFAIACTDNKLAVAFCSGLVSFYALPTLTPQEKVVLPCHPRSLSINNNGSRVAVLDTRASLFFVELDLDEEKEPHVVDTKRRNVWNVQWADDHPDYVAILDKSHMYIMRGESLEEPVLSAGHVCSFRNLAVTSIVVSAVADEIRRSFVNEEHRGRAGLLTHLQDNVAQFDTRPLRDARTLLHVDLQEALHHAEQVDHERVWKLVAEEALRQLDFTVAEAAYVGARDYAGIHLARRVRQLGSDALRRAHAHLVLEDFDTAESTYKEMGRDDLLTRMNVMTGNWERIRSTAMAEALSDNSLQPPMSDQAARWRMLRELAKRGNKAAELAVEATVTLGRKHADALQWTLAKKEFEKVDDADGLFRVYNRLERFADLASLAERLEDDSPWVVRIARTLADVGLCDGATNCFLRAGRVKDAVDTCIMLGHWERGIQLAEQYRIPQVESLFAKYAGHLLQRKDLAAKFEAAELYLRANKAMEAAGILDELCTHELSRKSSLLRCKKLAVLGAVHVERMQRTMLNRTAQGTTTAGQGSTTAAATMATLETMMTSSRPSGGKKKQGPQGNWELAEAAHFALLAQRRLYEGRYEAAATVARQLRAYDHVLDPWDVHAPMAVAGCLAGWWKTASLALYALQQLEPSGPLSELVRKLAVSVFSKHAREDPPARVLFGCPRCQERTLDERTADCEGCGHRVRVCVASGAPIPTLKDRSGKWREAEDPKLWPQGAAQVEKQIWECIRDSQFALEGMEELSQSMGVSSMTRAAFQGILRSRVGLVVGKPQLDALAEKHAAEGGGGVDVQACAASIVAGGVGSANRTFLTGGMDSQDLIWLPGKPIKCRTCSHSSTAQAAEEEKRSTCALCHTLMPHGPA